MSAGNLPPAGACGAHPAAGPPAAADAVSPWVAHWAPALRPGGCVLDLAAGSGRHARYLAARGHPVEAVDRDVSALTLFAAASNIRVLEADLEAAAWPYPGRTFDGIVITHYLYRPLFPRILAALAPGGLLICETFMTGNARYGRPSNPDFLLRPNELLEVVAGRLDVLGFEQGYSRHPKPAMMQRICARKAAAGL